MNGLKLWIDGDNTFSRLLQLIRTACKTIEINMFIWRDDRIGNKIAAELLAAADRGVNIYISKDKFGSLFEKAEENKQSFFNKETYIPYIIPRFFLDIIYPMPAKAESSVQQTNQLAAAMFEHPQITVNCRTIKHDHSKYYIFDNQNLLIGGINIEDKELYSDCRGDRYHDFMLEINGADQVSFFRERMNNSKGELLAAGKRKRLNKNIVCDDVLKKLPDIDYFFNHAGLPSRLFTVEDNMLSLLEQAAGTVKIIMPYIGDKKITQAIIDCARRNVKVDLLMPVRSNLQNNLNMKVLGRMMDCMGNRVSIWLTPLMCHGKMIIVDDAVMTVGSANLNRSAAKKLGELNAVVADKAVVRQAIDNFNQKKNGCNYISRKEQLEYSRILAFFENIFQ